jgi:hypothetical protein
MPNRRKCTRILIDGVNEVPEDTKIFVEEIKDYGSMKIILGRGICVWGSWWKALYEELCGDLGNVLELPLKNTRGKRWFGEVGL